MEMYRELFEMSQRDSRGLTLFINGQQVAGIVVRTGEGWIELQSQIYDRIVVRLEQLDAVAL